MVKLILCISAATLFVLSNCDLIGYNRFSNRVQSHLHHIKAAIATENRNEIQIYKWMLKHKQVLATEMKRLITKPSSSTNIQNWYAGRTNRLSRYNQNMRYINSRKQNH